MPIHRPIPGFVLAGGRSLRMAGQEKPFALLAGRTLLDHVIERARPQVEVLIVNAKNDARFLAPPFLAHGLLSIPDAVEGQKGPLAGVLTGLEWAARNMPAASHIATFPCDAPFLPGDLVLRLQQVLAANDTGIAYAASAGKSHYAFALWPLKTMDALRQAIFADGLCRMSDWIARHKAAAAEYPCLPIDPFFNVNTPADLDHASRLVLELVQG